MKIGTAFLLAFVGMSGVAQQSSTPRTAIPLIASDSHHRPTSVTLESLVVADQKTPVTGASLVRGADLPVELGVMIDTSGSERSADFADILKAAKPFLTQVIRGSDDRAFILQFAAVPQATDWLNKEQLQNVPVNIKMGGGTALYDALAAACKDRMGARNWQKPTRRILVLISDGEDNISHITRDQAASEALIAGAVIFTIDTDLSAMSYGGAKTMQALAELTGGESFSQVGTQEIPKVLARVEGMIESMYYLTYVPPDASKSSMHEVEIKGVPNTKLKLSYARKYRWNQ